MAIDTRDKRASCYLIGMPWRNLAPNPDADLSDTGDRIQLSWLYRGITPTVQALVASLSGIVGIRSYFSGASGLRTYLQGKAGLK